MDDPFYISSFPFVGGVLGGKGRWRAGGGGGVGGLYSPSIHHLGGRGGDPLTLLLTRPFLSPYIHTLSSLWTKTWVISGLCSLDIF